jgi:hypothetical protein
LGGLRATCAGDEPRESSWQPVVSMLNQSHELRMAKTDILRTPMQLATTVQRVAAFLLSAAAATSCGGSSTSAPTPSTASVRSVSITGVAPIIGITAQFSATATFTDGTTQVVTSQAEWRSSNAVVVTVSGTGIVTGVGPGEADVTATFNSVAGSQHVMVTERPVETLSAPTPRSPISGQQINESRPTLTVENAAATGPVSAVTYRFEVSDLPSFPEQPVRTFTADGVPQGSGATSWVVNRDLGNDVLWYWRARATDGTVASTYSVTATFRTPTTCKYDVTPSLLQYSLGGFAQIQTISITTSGGCAWTATAQWVFLLKTGFSTDLHSVSGTGSAGIGTTANPNTGCDRTDVVKIRWNGGGIDIPASQRGSAGPCAR